MKLYLALHFALLGIGASVHAAPLPTSNAGSFSGVVSAKGAASRLESTGPPTVHKLPDIGDIAPQQVYRRQEQILPRENPDREAYHKYLQDKVNHHNTLSENFQSVADVEAQKRIDEADKGDFVKGWEHHGEMAGALVDHAYHHGVAQSYANSRIRSGSDPNLAHGGDLKKLQKEADEKARAQGHRAAADQSETLGRASVTPAQWTAIDNKARTKPHTVVLHHGDLAFAQNAAQNAFRHRWEADQLDPPPAAVVH